MLLMMLTLACRSSEPVLSGVSQPTAQELSVSTYVLPKNVRVDASYICGKRLEQVRGLLSEQLGDIQEVRTLPSRQGRELVFQDAQVREIDGQIYLLRVELPRPTRREVALASLNVPTRVDRPALLSDEIRVQWHAGFERIRMGRSVRWSELVVWVELRKFDPKKG